MVSNFVSNLKGLVKKNRLTRRAALRLRRHFCLSTSSFRRLPEAIIIGAQKSGTSSLWNYISGHPDIIPSISKEVHYFDDNYSKDEEWYRSYFPISKKGITIEATPRYIFDEGVERRIKEVVPEVKLIAVLRDPAERAYSHYRHALRGMGRDGKESRTFMEAIENDLRVIKYENRILGKGSYKDIYHSYLRRGIYEPQLKRFFNIFGDNVFVIPSFRLFYNTKETVNNVFRFLNVKKYNLIDAEVHNQGKYDNDIPHEAWLRDFFSEYNYELYSLLEVDSWWD